MEKMDKLEFLTTELGVEMALCVARLDIYLRELSACEPYSNTYDSYNSLKSEDMARLEVFKLAVKQLYGVEYCFTRTDDYYGMVTEDGTDWLLKRERNR